MPDRRRKADGETPGDAPRYLRPMPGRATADDLLAAYGTDGGAEIIHGEIVERPRGTLEHSRASGGFMAAIGQRFARRKSGRWPGGWWVLPAIHVQYEPHELFCHDCAGVRRDRVPEIAGSWPMQVRPDWVLEVLSPGHERRDRFDKWRVLQRAGIPHYWIVDPETKTLEVYRWHPDGFLNVLNTVAGETVRAEPFDAVELRVAVLFGDEDDEE